MIKKFKDYNLYLLEKNEDDDYIKELLDKIYNLEYSVDALKDEISDLNNQIDEKDNEIYGLEESFEKLEKQYSKLEDEKELLEKSEEKLIDEKKDLEAELKIFQESYTIFEKGTEEEKSLVIKAFLNMLDIMEDKPLEFGNLLRKETNKRSTFKRLINSMLNKEWLESYTGGGSGLLGRLGIKD